MQKADYHRYLASREWALIKEAVKKRDGGRCERCLLGAHDAVHHLTYERVGHESMDDVMGVCKPCHEFLSGKSDDDPDPTSCYFVYLIHSNLARICAWPLYWQTGATPSRLQLESYLEKLVAWALAADKVDGPALVYKPTFLYGSRAFGVNYTEALGVQSSLEKRTMYVFSEVPLGNLDARLIKSGEESWPNVELIRENLIAEDAKRWGFRKESGNNG